MMRMMMMMGKKGEGGGWGVGRRIGECGVGCGCFEGVMWCGLCGEREVVREKEDTSGGLMSGRKKGRWESLYKVGN